MRTTAHPDPDVVAPRRGTRRRLGGLTTAALTLATVVAVPVLAASPAAAASPACGTSGTPTVTSLQDPHFYVDSSGTPAFDSHYAGYRVTTGASGYQNLFVGLSNFKGADGSASLITLSPTQPANQAVGQIAASTTSNSYFLLKATGTTTASSPAQQHTISLWSGDPTLASSSVICTQTFGYTSIDDTVKANPNTITSTSTSSSSGAVGGTIDVAIVGTTGTIGNGPSGDTEVFDMSGAAVSTFPAGTWQLIKTTLLMSPDGSAPAQTSTDLLYKNNVGPSARTYTATYRFRAVGTSATSAPVYPMQYIASGTNVKHTTPPTGATLPSVPPASNTLTLAASVNPTMLPSIGGTATYSVVVSNSSSSPTTLDNLSFTLPSGVTYNLGSATFASAAITNPIITGSNLLFPGPWTIPASGSATFTLVGTFPASAGTYAASAVGHIGALQIDTTVTTADNAPATPSLVVNIPPSAGNDSASLYTGASTTVTVLSNDTVAAPYSKSITTVGSPAHGTATLNPDKTITYVSTGGYAGADSFTYALSDGYSTSTATVSLTVYANATAVADSADVYAGDAVTIGVLANDSVDPAYTKSVSAVGSAGHGTATANANGTITYTPTAGFTGTDSFTYTLSDGHGSTSVATVTVHVYAKASANNDSATVYDGDSVAVSVLGNDSVDPAYTKSVSAVGTPGHGTAVINPDGTITYTPTAGFTGTDTFGYTLSDGHGSTSNATVTVTVYAKASAVNDGATVYADGSVGISVLSNDSVDPTFTKSVSAVDTPGHGSAVLNPDGTITYTPTSGFSGTDSFGYTLTDGNGSTSNAVVTVTVYALPVATTDSATTSLNTGVVVAVLGNDSVDPAFTKSVSAVGSPSHGTATVNPDGTITYTPAPGYSGADSFTYTLADGNGATATGTVNVTVLAALPTSCGTNWQYNGSAAPTAGCQLLLTPETTKVAGTAFWPVAQPSAKIATVSFDTVMGTGTGADGIGLMFADATGATPTSIGGTGGQLGLAGIPGAAVTFDTFKNSGDPSANFVGLCTTTLTTGPIPGLKCTNTQPAPSPLRGASLTTHHVVVTTAILSGKTIVKSVTVDGTPVITNGLMQLPTSVLLGFGSATGSQTDTHIVANVVVTYRP